MSCATLGSGINAPRRTTDRRPLRPGDEPLLSADQERALGRAIAAGDSSARDRLARANLGLVVTIARGFLNRGLPMEDLVGEGNLGLIRAATKYDPAFGVRFSTYAGYWIREAIQAALVNTAGGIRVPAHMARRLREWRRAERALEAEGDQAPDFERVARRLELSEKKRTLIGHALRARRLGGVGGAEDGASRAIEDLPDAAEGPEASLERSDQACGLRARMAQRLTAGECRLMELRYGLEDGEPLTLKEVGRRLGMTREGARKLEIRAVAKLRG